MPASSSIREKQFHGGDAATQSLLSCLHDDALMLVLVRHGQRGGPNREEQTGRLGKTLTPLGMRQARRMARRLAPLPIDHLYTSDMARAHQTAQELHKLRPDVPFEVLSELREVRGWYLPYKGPARTLVERREAKRDRDAIARFARRLQTKHKPGQLVVAVVHGGVIRCLVPHLVGIEPRRSLMLAHHNTGVTVVSIPRKGTPVVRLANCTRHLLPAQIGGDVLP